MKSSPEKFEMPTPPKETLVFEQFETGARRGSEEGKGRFDQLPAEAIMWLARVCEWGVTLHGNENAELGIPVRRFISAALRHGFQARMGLAADIWDGDPVWHLFQMAWNALYAGETILRLRRGELPKELGFPPLLNWPRPLRIYVAGPYRAATPSERDHNICMAEGIGKEILRRGHFPHVPHVHTRGWDEAVSFEEIMRHDLNEVRLSDALFFIGPSEGANIELERAEKLGKLIFRRLDDVPDLTTERNARIAANLAALFLPRDLTGNGEPDKVPTARPIAPSNEAKT